METLTERKRYLRCKNSDVQGCALTAPGCLRRLTFGFGRVRKITQLIVFLHVADKVAKNFNMLVVTVYETVCFFFIRNNWFKAVPHDFTCKIINDFARDGRRLPHEF